MKRIIFTIIIAACAVSLIAGISYAGSSRTWSTIGKGLAIYEGVKVLTGRQGNIVDDVTGGMQPKQSSTPASSGDDYNAGYKEGYEEGYNAGFRNGVEQTSK